ncbi:MAG: hypothetical protein K8T26_10945 [Lentisphaerae bacterium]|nr:hypothetical protein [Lentisphaerota bacterium]
MGQGSKPKGSQRDPYPPDPRNPFRHGSDYAMAFDILASHPDGLHAETWARLLATATGKDIRLATYDCRILMTARRNEEGLSNNDSPRHRSCRPGFWIGRENNHVRLMVD